MAGPRWSSAPLVTPASKDLACLSRAPTGMFRQWSVQSGPAPRRSESQASSEDLWKQEVERLCASRTPVRMLPYAMADKRFIRELREPEGVKNSCWQRWHRPRQVARQQLGEAAKRLGRGFGLWEGALYEIGGRIPSRPSLPTSLVSPSVLVHSSNFSCTHLAGRLPFGVNCARSPIFALGSSTLAHDTQSWDSHRG